MEQCFSLDLIYDNTSTLKTLRQFSGDRISDEAASAVTGGEPLTMALAKVDGSSAAEFSDRKVEDMTVRTTPVTGRVS